MRFDVYDMPPGGRPGFLVDVQAEILADLATRMVIPLINGIKPAKAHEDLNPEFEIAGEQFVLMTQELASIQKRHLKKPVGSLAIQHDAITRALDILLTGF